jgi:hypothetical protein
MDERHAAPRSTTDDVGTDPLHRETSDAETPPDTSHGSVPRLTESSPDNPSRVRATRRRILGYVALLAGSLPVVFARPATAQSSVGSELCGTPIAEFINSTVPLVVALAMIAGLVFAFLMHARSGVARDTEQARFYREWRNRAGYTAVTVPLLAFLLQMLIGFTGTGIADCVDMVPFF